MTTPVDTRVAEIISCEQQADEHLKASEELRWRAAELIAAELAEGKTQRQLAAEIGKTQPHVCYMARAWQLALDNPVIKDHPFTEAYRQAKLSDSARAEEARLSAVSYRNVIYDPAGLMLNLFAGIDVSRIAEQMEDFPEYATVSADQLVTLGETLIKLAEASR